MTGVIFVEATFLGISVAQNAISNEAYVVVLRIIYDTIFSTRLPWKSQISRLRQIFAGGEFRFFEAEFQSLIKQGCTIQSSGDENYYGVSAKNDIKMEPWPGSLLYGFWWFWCRWKATVFSLSTAHQNCWNPSRIDLIQSTILIPSKPKTP